MHNYKSKYFMKFNKHDFHETIYTVIFNSLLSHYLHDVVKTMYLNISSKYFGKIILE